MIGGALHLAACTRHARRTRSSSRTTGSTDDLTRHSSRSKTASRSSAARMPGPPRPEIAPSRLRPAITWRVSTADDEYLPDRLRRSRRRRSAPRPRHPRDRLALRDGRTEAGRFQRADRVPSRPVSVGCPRSLLRRCARDSTDATTRDRRIRRVAAYLGRLGRADPPRTGRRCGRPGRRTALSVPASPRKRHGRPVSGTPKPRLRARGAPLTSWADSRRTSKSSSVRSTASGAASCRPRPSSPSPNCAPTRETGRSLSLGHLARPAASGCSALSWAIEPRPRAPTPRRRHPTEQASSSPWWRSSQ